MVERRKESGNQGCLPFIKFWLGIFVRGVYHLPKISGMSRFIRLDSSYNVKLSKLARNLKKLVNDKRIFIRNVPTGKTGLLFPEIPFVPEIFQWDEAKKRLPFTSQQEFPVICGKW